MYRIMIIEDDDKIASILQQYIERYGYEVIRATRFRELKQEYIDANPHLVLLDINLPHFDGFYWCRQIRTVSNVPIIFLSARVGDMDQVMAIENGGDDYMTKPFHLDVVMAKIKSALRRAYGEYAAPAPSSTDVLTTSGLTLDRARNIVEWNGSQADLSRNECLLLASLLAKAGRIVSRDDLLEALWDNVDFVDDNTLNVNVTRVRKKLEELGLPKVIETVRGQGYRLDLSLFDSSR
ncbi:DNA-binding response OmpR family regulator [Paenibacillus cellulosilyticus]|uniref:DNA-binding response OmpR family regulator n=1 Tax=Paenibacillus cellulosilyticus TaxID=375489 RepID=A0A2V2YH12_9BACL|nr:response regulator transcription factor [Paenibacillus cellulosilyticus]PWV92085.1 DNA-binding response OmpR family regulator [Paenibacillus cellulosilyticus]QKS44195.1 response regulator transcription factor [Paenibacillus cellulosilyticus]